jgi:RNA-binding protein YlmH
MGASDPGHERQREKTRRDATESSVFLDALAGTSAAASRAVVRHDVHQKALEAARKVMRTYHSERQRQI